MNIDIKGTGLELTPAITDYATKRLSAIEKFIKDVGNARALIEIAKTTEHHKQGDIFRAEINFTGGKYSYRTMSEKSDLYAAIDDAKDDLERQIIENKDRGNTLFRRGARSVKKMLKGIAKRNPFTSKYDK